MRLCVAILLLTATQLVYGDEGLCSTEEPAPGQSCSSPGSGEDDSGNKSKNVAKDAVLKYEYIEREMTPEERKAEEQMLYDKMGYTNEIDWEIRDLLDTADDFIANDAEKAIEMFSDILQEHPNSIRAHYAFNRAHQFLNTSGWSEEKIAENSKKVVDRFVVLLNKHEEEVMDMIYRSSINQALITISIRNMTEEKVLVLETVLENREDARSNERYHELLISEFLASGNFDRAEKAISYAQEHLPNTIMFKVYEGLVLKLTGRKKEGNKLLRSLEVPTQLYYTVASEINELCHDLLRRGRFDWREMILKEASKLHVFLSQFQRPYDALPDLESSKPIWSVDDTEMTTYDEEFEELKAKVNEIREEYLEARKNDSNWMKWSEDNDGTGIMFKGGIKEFPLFSWAKRRSFSCSLAPTTCGVLRDFKTASKFPKGTIKFRVIAPKTRMAPITSPTNARVKIFLGLKVPENGFKLRVAKGNYPVLRQNEFLIFEDSYEHEISNESDEEVGLLSIDVPHPDLTYVQSKQTFMAQARNQYIMY